MGIRSEIQKLAPSALIDLFELDATPKGGPIMYFHAGTNELGGNVVWQGKEYVRFPIEATGFEKNTQGTLPRPVVRVSNLNGLFAAEARKYDYFLGCKVTRRRTMARFLDSVNFLTASIAEEFDSRPTPAYYYDSGLNLLQVAANVERPLNYDFNTGNKNAGPYWEKTAAKNWSRFNSGKNGAAGVWPDGWSASTSAGVTVSVVGSIVIGNIRYTDIRIQGTPTASSSISGSIVFDSLPTAVPLTENRNLTASANMSLVAGSLTNTGLSFGYQVLGPTGLSLASGTMGSLTALTAALRRYWGTRLFNTAGMAYVRPNIRWGFSVANVAYDFTIRIGVHQCELDVTTPSSPIVTEGVAVERAADVTRTTSKGNPYADPDQYLPDEIWYIDRRSAETPQVLELELASSLDLQGIKLPRRQCIQNTCSWVYRDEDCGYTGPGMTVDRQATNDPALDRCGKTRNDCKARYGTQPLPFGGFPGVGLIR